MNLRKKEKTADMNQVVLDKNELAGQDENTEIVVEGKKKPKKKKNPITMKTLKKYFNQKTFLGIGLAGILLLVIVYVFVYLDYAQKTEELQASNAELKKTVNELQTYYDNMDKYKIEIEDIRTSIQDIMAEYPADAREEDIIMLGVQLQEKNAIAYDAINMEETEGVYTVPYDSIRLADIEGYDRDLNFTRKHGTYANVTTYDNLKGCVEQIFASQNRIGIKEIVYVRNEEDGTLEGNIDLYFYSASGTGKEYVAPDIAEYLAGTSDLFNSGKVIAKKPAEDGESAEEGENDENEENNAEDAEE